MADQKRASEIERMGTFYLGRTYAQKQKAIEHGLLLYDSKDLTTHAVIVGMTGSGKTGLGIGLLEEAAIDGVPSIVIDPKGDMPNLMLTFPELRPADFEPWVSVEEASKKELSRQDFAAQQAELWKNGLAEWAQSGARIQRLREEADVVVYTPGSQAGVPVSVLRAFSPPGAEVLRDPELLSEQINATVSGLLGLLQIEADPIQSREHILLSAILENAWRAGQSLELPGLIAQVQNPPMPKVGVLETDTFYPADDRFKLVLALNNLLAAPGFEVWREGVPLDVTRFLHDAKGKPQISIFSIAHLNDTERMFFVSLLLSQLVSWVRAQSGTGSLRAVLYMDEVFGFLPPVANPPSKRPLLTLLKQARAVGLGVVLATQNPVDLDYKALSNTGTWFLGRLQTERDKLRVMEALEGWASNTRAAFDKQEAEETLAGLASRVFLMHNVHEDEPALFHTRWALSYLAGPMTRDQIRDVMAAYKAAHPIAEAPLPAASPAPSSPSPQDVQPAKGGVPSLPPQIDSFFAPLVSAGAAVTYRPVLFGAARISLRDAARKVDYPMEVAHVVAITDGAVPVNWETSQPAAFSAQDLKRQPPSPGSFAALPKAATKVGSYTAWKREYKNWLAESQSVELFLSPSSGMVSNPGESEGDFRVRVQQATHEARDASLEKLRKRYASKLRALQDRARRAEQALEKKKERATEQKVGAAISVGSTLLGAMVGRKVVSHSTVGRATTAARGLSRSGRYAQEVEHAEDTLEVTKAQLEALEAEFAADAANLKADLDPLTEPLETLQIAPKKTLINVQVVALTWTPG
jgi:DNA helicase HerA-like ATPase